MASARVLDALGALVDVMARLRGPDGCPWDREQTPETLRPFLLEETYKVLDAIDHGRTAEVREELGDLLLQIVFQSQLAAEEGRFDLADVARAITEKLVRRHPHVFGDVTVRDADEVVRNWKRIKAEERRQAGESDVFAGVPKSLPALAHAEQLGEKAAQLGLDWENARGPLDKIREEYDELVAAVVDNDGQAIRHELGDLLHAITSLARHLGVPAELTLREANRRFVARVHRTEAAAQAGGAPLATLDAETRERLWRQARTPDPPERV